MTYEIKLARAMSRGLLVSALTVALAACGGGGSRNDTGTSKPPVNSGGTGNGSGNTGGSQPGTGTPPGTDTPPGTGTGNTGTPPTNPGTNPMLPPDPGKPGTPNDPTGPLNPGPTVAALTLPLELLSDGDKPFTAQAVLNLKSADIGNAAYLTFTCHRCAFFGAPEWEKTARTPTKVKGSVRVLGNAANEDSVQWVDITDATMEMPPAERYQGGLTVSGLYTARLKLKLDAAMRARLTDNAAGNRIQFRFNGTDGESNGYRIIALDFQDNTGKGLSTNAVKQADIKAEKDRSWSSDDVAKGEQLWHAGGILVKSTIVNRKLNASCQSCHADDGRDLQYFNYSDNSIVQRSRFHGLSEAQGKQIVAYVRANKEGAVHVAQAAPWNPPYQPGPGLDSKDIREWAAGAGLGAVTDDPVRALNALFGKPLDSAQASIAQADVDVLMDPNKVQNTRETATSLQMPDWNAWLPAISPEDVWPDDRAESNPQHFHGSFNQGATASNDSDTWPNGRRTPKQQMEALDGWLTANKSSKWGDWSHLDGKQRFQTMWKMQNLGWESWRFGGGGRSFKIAGNGKKNGVEIGADNMLRHADAGTMALNPQGNNYASFVERSVLALAQWQIVRQWNLVQKHGLEGDQRWFIGALDSKEDNFKPIGEKRGWAMNTPGVFFVAPHMAYQETKNESGDGVRNMIFQWEDNKNPVGSYYRSNIWYDLAMVISPGAAQQVSNYPVDWGYHVLFSAMMSGSVRDQNKDGQNLDARELALTHLLREVQVKAKNAQQNVNGIDASDTFSGRAGAISGFNPSWLLREGANSPSRFEDLDLLQDGLYRLIFNGAFKQFNDLLGVNSGMDPAKWSRCDPNLEEVDGVMQQHFGPRHCVDKLRPVIRTDDKGAPYLRGHGWSTTAEGIAYAAEFGKRLGAESGRLADFNRWIDTMWPGNATSSDMQAQLNVSSDNVRAGEEVTVTATCTNLGAGKYSGDPAAVNAMCRIKGLPDGVSANCSRSMPVPRLGVNESVTCSATFRPTGNVRLVAFANSWSFDPVPTMATWDWILREGNNIKDVNIRVN